MYWYEWSKTPNSRCGFMVAESELSKFIDGPNTSGFRSVYGYKEEHAKIIKKRGSSKGFKEFPAYADTLVIDIDNGDEGLQEILPKVKGFEYDLFSSGGKGYHIIIPCDKMYSSHTPYSQRKFVESLNIEPDLSIYRHSGLISLPGRVHPKTKNLKTFIKHVEGTTATIPIKIPPLYVKQLPDDYSYTADGFERAAELCLIEPSEGNRYMSLWYCVKCFADSGMDINIAREIVSMINETWVNSKPEDELDRVIEDCYG